MLYVLLQALETTPERVVQPLQRSSRNNTHLLTAQLESISYGRAPQPRALARCRAENASATSIARSI